MDWTKFVDLLKLAPRYLSGLLVACVIFLILPPRLNDWLGLSQLQQVGRPWISVAAIVLSSLLLSYVVAYGMQKVRQKRERGVEEKRRTNRLSCLTAGETLLLRRYVVKKSRTQSFGADGVALELEHDGIIRKATDVTDAIGRTVFNLEPWAFDLLIEHPELLGLNRETLENKHLAWKK